MNNVKGQPIEILLVDDNPVDRKLTIKALREGRVLNRVHEAEDGEKAMAFLRNEGEYRYSPRPDLVLLDLNMPRKGGNEVLTELKKDEQLKQIPVIIMTVSQAPDDVLAAYRSHANSYITKPLNLDEFTRVVRSIEEFWMSVVRLPPREEVSP